MTAPNVIVSRGGIERWHRGHPWIYASDVQAEGLVESGTVVRAVTAKGDVSGYGFWSSASKIAVRMITRSHAPPDEAFWFDRLRGAIALRERIAPDSTAMRLVHSDADRIPGLIVDRYGDHLVVQTNVPGAEKLIPFWASALGELLGSDSILLRNDASSRAIEGLPRETRALAGDPPAEVEVREGKVRFLADLRAGQKTGAFLDQRENRIEAGLLARGRVADLFCYHGSFALHAAIGAEKVFAVDSSAPALARGAVNARLNGLQNIEFIESNVFDFLKQAERSGERFDTVFLDPPAFAKKRSDVPAARRAYKDINLRALRVLKSGGLLVTSSCSYNLSEPDFLETLVDAASDARRTVRILMRRGAAADHPVRLGLPESAYLKCAFLLA